MTSPPTAPLVSADEGKERPIIMSGPMVRAILVGRKTQTRRIVKRPTDHFNASYTHLHQEGERFVWSDGRGGCQRAARMPAQIGDRLWVRETAAVRYTGWHHVDGHSHSVSYAADEDNYGQFIGHGAPGGGIRKGKAPSIFPDESFNKGGRLRWVSPIFMPRWASRLTLEVTDVRVERLQGISEADAQAEGIERSKEFPDRFLTPAGDYAVPVVAYQRLWNSIHGKDAWDANPWVCAISFRRIQPDAVSSPAAEGERA